METTLDRAVVGDVFRQELGVFVVDVFDAIFGKVADKLFRLWRHGSQGVEDLERGFGVGDDGVKRSVDWVGRFGFGFGFFRFLGGFGCVGGDSGFGFADL